ncbi:MAG: hypothetical protein FWH43_03780 [Endomicrobia bacterium]|nr:hypothetical protein [Endomicrobiia bacterium]
MGTKYKRKIIVKPKIEWRYFIVLAITILICTGVCYYAFLFVLQNVSGIEQLNPETVKSFKNAYIGGFLWIIFVFALFVVIQSLVYFHRLIGPLFFFEKVMKKVSGGDFTTRMHWRKGDTTKELAVLIGQVIDNTKASVLEDRRKIEEAVAAMDAGNKDKAKEILSTATKWCITEKPSENKKE